MIENLKVGDVVQFDAIPQFFVEGGSPFGISYESWNKHYVNKHLIVKELGTYRSFPSFRVVQGPNNPWNFLLPIQGARLVSRANPASVVNKSPRKDSKMKFKPRSNKFVSNRVLAVTKDGPASKGGVQVGDTILKVGKYQVGPNTKIGDIVQQLGKKGAFRKITVKVSRNGKSKFCHVTLGRDSKTGKAVLGIDNNPKKVVNKPLSKEMTWADHSRAIVDNKAKLAAASEKRKLEAALSKTKAEADAAAMRQNAAVAELANAKDAAKAAAEEDNAFLRQAREELEAVQARLADMKGADALLEAKALRAKLRAKNLNSLDATTDKVNKYLEKIVTDRAKETEIAPISRRRISWRKTLAAAAVLGTAVAGGAYAYINFLPGLLG